MKLDETWNVLDSTKIDSYMGCPRQNLYNYIFGWVTDVEKIDFVFGRAWHEAQEQLLITGYNMESIAQGCLRATEAYREAYPVEETDVDRLPKVPKSIDLAMLKYVKEYEKDDVDTETVYTEIAGKVPINSDKNWFLHFKMDSILKDKRGVFSREHKTGSANSRQWRDGFKLRFQIGTYNHVLYCLYPVEEVWGIEVGGAVFTKGKGVEFVRIPVRKHPRMMEAWLYQANYYYSQYMKDIELLQSKDGEKEEVLDCFQLRTVNCTAYRGCPYMDFCLSWANPLQYDVTKPPEGFKIEFWNPSKQRETAKKVIDL
jgi:hypothetical protein